MDCKLQYFEPDKGSLKSEDLIMCSGSVKCLSTSVQFRPPETHNLQLEAIKIIFMSLMKYLSRSNHINHVLGIPLDNGDTGLEKSD